MKSTISRASAFVLVLLLPLAAYAADPAITKAIGDAVKSNGVKVKLTKALEGQDRAAITKLIRDTPAGLHIGQAGVQITADGKPSTVTVQVTCRPNETSIVCRAADARDNHVTLNFTDVRWD